MGNLKQPEALWLQPIPPAQHASRQQLVNIANAYFEAVQKNDGKGFYPFTDDCDRIENGSHTTNTPSPNPTTPGGFNYMGASCKKQLESGYLRIENSLIRRVEMIGTGVPYHFNSSWGPFLRGK
jgi:hypothetical protein